MNHVLKKAPADRAENLATYANPSLPLHEELLPAIEQFIKMKSRMINLGSYCLFNYHAAVSHLRHCSIAR